MPLDLTSARQSFQDYLMGDACYLLRPRELDDGAGSTIPDPAGPIRIGPLQCGFTSVTGDEAAEDIIAVRGRYRLKLPVITLDPDSGDEVIPLATDLIEFQGVIYPIVWAPPTTALSLKRKIGLKDS